MASLKGLHPGLRRYAEAFVLALQDRGLNPRITSTRRSVALQRRLYRRYLQGRSDFPAAPPGRSAHQAGLAFDLVTRKKWWQGLNDEAGAIWNSWGGRWAGPPDRVHFGL